MDSIERIAGDTTALKQSMDMFDLSVRLDTSLHKGKYRDIILLIESLFEQLREILMNIGVTAGQISAGSGQISDGAQSLAQGATEQAAAIEESLQPLPRWLIRQGKIPKAHRFPRIFRKMYIRKQCWATKK